MTGKYGTLHTGLVTASGLQLRLLYLHFGNPAGSFDRRVSSLPRNSVSAKFPTRLMPHEIHRCISETSFHVAKRSAYHSLRFNLLALRADVRSHYLPNVALLSDTIGYVIAMSWFSVATFSIFYLALSLFLYVMQNLLVQYYCII